jgi:hypothetical protein
VNYTAGAYSDRAMDSMRSVFNTRSYANPNPGDDRVDALEKAYAWSDQGLGLLGGVAKQSSAQVSELASFGLNQQASEMQHQWNVEAAKAAAAAQKKSGLFGAISSIASTLAPLALCERRYKENIQPLADVPAWDVVRDLALYAFSYRMTPGRQAYGPIVDEVQQLDPSLVRPSAFGADEEGPVHGLDVLRFEAYQTLALQQALQRIEQLERKLAALEATSKPDAAIPRQPAPLLLAPLAQMVGSEVAAP